MGVISTLSLPIESARKDGNHSFLRLSLPVSKKGSLTRASNVASRGHRQRAAPENTRGGARKDDRLLRAYEYSQRVEA